MKSIRNLPIRKKVVAVTMLTAGVALLLTCGALLWFELSDFRAKLQRDVATLAKVIGANSVAAVSFGDQEAATELLAALRAEPQIRAACIFDRDGRTLATFTRPGFGGTFPNAPAADGFTFTSDRLTYFGAIDDERERARVGTIYFEADFGEMRRRIGGYAQLLAIVFAASGLVALALAAVLQRYIAGPIESLATTTERVTAERDYSLRVPPEGGDELGKLIGGFNEMLSQIQTRDAALQAAHNTLEKRVEERTAQLQEQVAERSRAEERNREQASLLDLAQDAIVVRDMNDVALYWNKGAERVFGWAAAEVLGRELGRRFHKDAEKFIEAQREVLRSGEWAGELVRLHKDGRQILTESRWTLLRDADGRPKSILTINTDVTERKKLEAQFLRAQRMESIGTLAGGIAHDLNNVLAPIMMSVDLLRAQNADPTTESILEALEIGTERGADLVRQILCFARGAEGKRVPLEAERVAREVFKIARDTFPKNIRVELALADGLWGISGNATQLHQVLLNLCVNARDAMPDGGRLTISAENFISDGSAAALQTAPGAGPHLVLRVSDTGTGIPPEMREKIFEPFFTTKEIGKGTGLGLSTAIAIVKGHAGLLDFTTGAGTGTTFTLCLPATPAAKKEDAPAAAMWPTGQQQLVLVVDDESSIRLVVEHTLNEFGYRVLTAPDGATALGIYAERKDEISLVLTDMMMPGMDGNATIRGVKAMNPDARIIAATGMMTDERLLKAADAGAVAFLRKPYTAEVLLRTLSQVLGSPVEIGAAAR